jgi:S-layer protein
LILFKKEKIKMAFPTNANQVQAFAGAMYGQQVGSVTLAQVNSDILSAGGLNKALNAYYAVSFGTQTTAAVGTLVAANLGLTGTAATDAAAYIAAVLSGTAASARGEAIQGILNLFSTLTANATFGAAATAWNAKVDAAAVYTGSTDVAIGTVVSTPFSLTTGVDAGAAFTGGAGNDTFSAIGSVAAGPADSSTLNSGDTLNGGAGNDTLNLRVTTAAAAWTTAPQLTSIETVSISNISATANLYAVNLASATGTTTVEFKDNTATGQTAFIGAATTAAISLNNADSATQNVNLGAATGRTGTADAFAVTIANGSGSSTANAGLQLVTADGTTADTSFETANVTVAGAANFVQVGTSLAGLTTLNVTGAGTNTTGYAVTLTEAANFASLKTINLSGVTAGGASVQTTGATDLAFTGSANNDRLVISGGTGNLTSADAINFGEGANDVLAFGTDTAIASYNATKLGLINAITTADTLEFTAAALTTLKANDFTINKFVLSGGNTTTATTVAITGVESADTFTAKGTYLAAAAADQTGATAGTAGVDAITFTGAAVAQTANLLLDGGRSVTGMAGQSNSNAGTFNGGTGGDAIDFGGNITKLVINSTGTTANSLTGGAGGAETGGGAGGAGGAAIANTTAVQTVDITGSTALTIAGGAGGAATVAVAQSAAFSGAVNVNAAAFTAKLTLGGSTGADIVTAGSGGTVYRSFGGADNFTAGSGVDQINLLTAADSATAATALTLTGFTAGSDKIVVGTLPTAIKSGALYTAAGTGTLATDFATAITAGGALAANNAALITITGAGAGTYLVYDANGNGAYADAGADIIVKLVGTVGTLSVADFATATV